MNVLRTFFRRLGSFPNPRRETAGATVEKTPESSPEPRDYWLAAHAGMPLY